MSGGVNVEVTTPRGTRFVLENANMPYVRDVYPASEGYVVRVLPSADAGRRQ